MQKAGLSKEQAIHLALTGGDDYELAFTLPVLHYDTVENLLNTLQVPFTVIGQIVPEKRFRLFDDNDNDFHLFYTGFQHFKD
jgi:thiamine-monophosphate kinase